MYDTSNDLISFIDYVSQLHPGFGQIIRGASSAEIQRMEQLLGCYLPTLYKSYLSRMGQDDGGLNIGRGSTTNIEDVIEYYQEIVDLGEQTEALPQDCIVIAVSGGGTFELSLELQEDREPRVLFTSGRKKKGLYAESIEKLLFRQAFIEYRVASFPYSGIYLHVDKEEPSVRSREIAVGLGFHAQWFSDEVTFCGDKGNAAIVIEQFLGRPAWIRVAADRKDEIETIGSSLVSQAGVAFQQWWPE